MPKYLTSEPTGKVVPLIPLRAETSNPEEASGVRECGYWIKDQSDSLTSWVKSSGFEAKSGTVCPLPGEDGALAGMIVGLGDAPSI